MTDEDPKNIANLDRDALHALIRKSDLTPMSIHDAPTDPVFIEPQFFEDTSQYDEDPDRFLKLAKQFVVGAHAVETAETEEPELTIEELYIVWFSKTLQNWKALVSTTRSGDGLYFEVTHNGEKLETYVDTYRKTANNVFSHHDF